MQVNEVISAFAALAISGGDLFYLLVLIKQFSTFKISSSVQPLKYFLISLVSLQLLGSLPIIYLFADRAFGHPTTTFLANFVSLDFVVKFVGSALLLFLVYNFHIDGD